MSGATIEVEGLYESKDYWRSYFVYYFNAGWLYFHFLTIALYGLTITFLFLKGDFDISHLADVFLVGGLFVILSGLTMSFLSATSAKNLEWGSFKYIVSVERIEIVSDTFTSYLEWSWFAQIKETRNYFMLTSKYGQKTLLPKRFFRDSEQMSHFKNLICEQLGDKVYLKKSKKTLGLK